MNLEETVQIVGYLGAFHPGWVLTKDQIRLWHAELGDLDFEQSQEAARSLVRTEPRWPTVAGFRRVYAARAGLLAPSWSDAWAEASAAVQSYDEWKYSPPPEWSHPAVGATVALLGRWEMQHTTNLDTMRAQFRGAYEQQAAQHDAAALATMRPPAPPMPALPSVDQPVEALPERGEFPAELVAGMREEWPEMPEPSFAKARPTIAPSDVKFSREVDESSAFVVGLREQGWPDEQIAAELARLGRVPVEG